MSFKLLTEHHLEFLSLKGGCVGSSGSTLVKMTNYWKPHAEAQILRKKVNSETNDMRLTCRYLSHSVVWTNIYSRPCGHNFWKI